MSLCGFRNTTIHAFIFALAIAFTIETAVFAGNPGRDEQPDRDVISDTEDYCTSTYSNTTDDWITNVTFNTINNNSGQDGPDSYGDYTDLSTEVIPGWSYSLSVSFFSDGQWTEYVRAWFDWNNNEIFEPVESYYLGRGIDSTMTRNIIVPLNAATGLTRFRIIEQYNSDAGPNGACDGQGNHTEIYGETEDYSLNILPPLAYDVSPAEFVSPIDTGQVETPFTPTVTYSNLGSAMVSFDVSMTIVFEGDTLYQQIGHIEDLAAYSSTDFAFPDYVPEYEGDLTLITRTLLNGDQNPANDELQLQIFVLPEFLPPLYLGAASDKNGLVPLSWFAPRTPPCRLIAYDNGTLADGFYYMDSENLVANSFQVTAPAQICTVFVHVLTEGDEHWPWPDSHHDPVNIKIFANNGHGLPGDTLYDELLTAYPREDIVIPFNPPLICETNLFWVSFNNISDNGPYDAIGLDALTNYGSRKWVYQNGTWQLFDIFPGDQMIRVKVIDFHGESLSGKNESGPDGLITDTEELLGYNIYRDTQPNVPIDSQHRIAREIPSMLYDDSDVENRTTYYYAITAVYNDSGEIGESAPSNEVSATPHEGGQLSSNLEEITERINSGHEINVGLTLVNGGDLDVDFRIVATASNYLSLTDNVKSGDKAVHAEFSSEKNEDQKTFEVEDINPPVVTGSGGPDEYGYIWIDSDEPNGPEYDWIDPSDHQVITMGDDENQGPFPIDFVFPFYGLTFNSFRICSNGFISFSSPGAPRNNTRLPDLMAPANLIAPFWDDLDPESGGTISWHSDQQKTVVSWVDVPHYAQSGGPYTFQVVLYPNGEIRFNYDVMFPSVTGATVGIQNSSRSVGLDVVHNSEYIHDDLTTLIKNGWLRTQPIFGTVQAGDQLDVNVILDATYLAPNAYEGLLAINVNDINGVLPAITIPVTLDVQSSIDDNSSAIPATYSLAQNYPNPFNATTSIGFALPEPSTVELSIYNLLGQKMATPVSGKMQPGYHRIIWDASGFSSGVYFYRLTAGDFSEIHQMTLLK